jgi:hypothetical protein
VGEFSFMFHEFGIMQLEYATFSSMQIFYFNSAVQHVAVIKNNRKDLQDDTMNTSPKYRDKFHICGKVDVELIKVLYIMTYLFSS